MDDRMHGEKKEQMEKGDGPLHHLKAQILFENLSFYWKLSQNKDALDSKEIFFNVVSGVHHCPNSMHWSITFSLCEEMF